MDPRALAELELLSVAKLYGLDRTVVPVKTGAQPATPTPSVLNSTWSELRAELPYG